MKVNTHELKMNGLRKAAGETKDLTDYYSGHYIQISYDTATGKIYSDYFYDLGHGSRQNYHDAEIITIDKVCSPKTMQQIADMIKEELRRRECLR